ncbi:hypothetical protein QJQ45_007058 [Haematococcus lacustris]|nr:hypothetical protein QJQ45_007058 [Haematococcus lacustris]
MGRHIKRKRTIITGASRGAASRKLAIVLLAQVWSRCKYVQLVDVFCPLQRDCEIVKCECNAPGVAEALRACHGNAGGTVLARQRIATAHQNQDRVIRGRQHRDGPASIQHICSGAYTVNEALRRQRLSTRTASCGPSLMQSTLTWMRWMRWLPVQQVAAILSNVFKDVGTNFAAVASGAPASAAPVGVVTTTPSQSLPANVTLDPSIVKLLNQSMANGVSPSVITAIQKALLQQQQAGSDLGTLQGAARTVASFLSLPATLGTGANIRDFTARIDQLRALRDSVRTFLGADEYVAITNYLLTAAQLGLQFVAAFPLAQLAYVVAQLALGAAITGLIAAIFYIVGSALAIAATIPGLQAALADRDNAAGLTNNGVGATIPTRSSEETSTAPSAFMPDPLLLDITNKATDIYMPVVAWAFSKQATGGLTLVNGLLSAVTDGMSMFTGITNTLG